MLNGYYYENIGDHINTDFSLWYLDKECAQILLNYKNDFGILNIDKTKRCLKISGVGGVAFQLEEGIEDGVAGKFPEGLAKKLLEQNSAEQVKIILDDFFG